MERFKRGDAARIGTGTSLSEEAFRRRGQVCKIVSRPVKVCYDYGWTCVVEFADGVRIEVDLDELELELADVVTQLGHLAAGDPSPG